MYRLEIEKYWCFNSNFTGPTVSLLWLSNCRDLGTTPLSFPVITRLLYCCRVCCKKTTCMKRQLQEGSATVLNSDGIGGLIQYCIRCLIMRSHKVLKSWDWVLECSYSQIWHSCTGCALLHWRKKMWVAIGATAECNAGPIHSVACVLILINFYQWHQV